MIDNALCWRIKQIRRSLNLTQKEYAEKVGSLQSTISDIERGIIEPSKDIITHNILKLDVDGTWLLSGKGEMWSKKSEAVQQTSYLTDLSSALTDEERALLFGDIDRVAETNSAEKYGAIITDLANRQNKNTFSGDPQKNILKIISLLKKDTDAIGPVLSMLEARVTIQVSSRQLLFPPN